MDKPLHVQVAEALGWTWVLSRVPGSNCRWLCPPVGPIATNYGLRPERHERATGQEAICTDGLRYVPHYDTDWSATGPLIEKYRLTVVAYAQDPNYGPDDAARAWFPGSDDINDCTHDAYGPTPLIAACNLILALYTKPGNSHEPPHHRKSLSCLPPLP